ncbi:MAG TPA: hypothetical protein VFB74_36405 [Kribbellaceae bacterium]|nr:hypothetical protein [Kribbellaceae bacterium]
MIEHLVAVGKDPYNVDLNADTVEYLLMNGRAVVIFDGLDELTDIALRQRVTPIGEYCCDCGLTLLIKVCRQLDRLVRWAT